MTRYFRTWVTRILINACYDTRRRHRRVVCHGGGPGAVRAASRTRRLAMALEQLPQRLRLPLVMHYAEGMSYAEIARCAAPSPIHRPKPASQRDGKN